MVLCKIILIFFSGRTVSEEKPKDAGHFDPFHHSHCSNYYSFWNKVLITHSSVFVFCLGVCCATVWTWIWFYRLSHQPGNAKKKSLWGHCGLVEMGFFLMGELDFFVLFFSVIFDGFEWKKQNNQQCLFFLSDFDRGLFNRTFSS